MNYRPSCSKSKRDTRRRNHIHLCKHNTLGLGWKKIKASGSWQFLEWSGSQKIIVGKWDIINNDHSLSRTQKSGRYKLEKKRKQVKRAESEKIKDVVLSQIEAEKEPFKFWKKFFWQFKWIHLNLFLKGFKETTFGRGNTPSSINNDVGSSSRKGLKFWASYENGYVIL